MMIPLKKPKKTIKVLVVEDEIFTRFGIVKTLEQTNDKKVVGEADNGETAIQLAKTLKPDVILMDVKLPTISGIETTKIILNRNPNIVILILTSHKKEFLMLDAINAGAKGFILKEEPCLNIPTIIDSVLKGKYYFDKISIAQFLPYSSPFSKLSSREHEVLIQILYGKNNEEIMKELEISYKTFNMHKNNIYYKLEVENDVQLIYLAQKHEAINSKTR